uniref:Uncharacterized protein n=1 Tax=Arundo donax TaxID=35708 RepID=A0A0A9ACN1_ARUDO
MLEKVIRRIFRYSQFLCPFEQ